MDYVKGYTCTNDVTVRDFVQNFYRPPVKAKGTAKRTCAASSAEP